MLAKTPKYTPRRISLWSGPRNISTALMYSFAQREDTQVVDEPLYGYFLRHSDADTYHPGAAQTLQEMETDGPGAVKQMLSIDTSPIVFFKNMTHHLLDLDTGFLKKMYNVILTRNPVEMLPSIAKVIPAPTMKDVGYQRHVELLQEIKDMGLPVVVLDAKRVLLDPENQLSALCKTLGIPFDKNMLAWKPGARPEDGSWARYWYANVHNSSGFQAYKPRTEPLPEHLKPLLAECMPYYEELSKVAL